MFYHGSYHMFSAYISNVVLDMLRLYLIILIIWRTALMQNSATRCVFLWKCALLKN